MLQNIHPQTTTQVAAANHPVFSNLKQLVCWGDDISSLHQSQQVFAIPNLRKFLIIQNKSAPSLALAILHGYQSVEEVELKCCSYEEIFSYGDIQKHAKAYARLKRLVLYELDNLKEIWKQDVSRLDPILQNSIGRLKVESCSSLISLMPPSSSFQYLTELRIVDCDHLMNLFDSATAKSLVQLEELYIRNCKVMKELISNGEARDVQITFNKLKFLDLHDLPDLTSFYPGNFTFTFPSLRLFNLRKCPKMKFFSSGVLNDGTKFICGGELNATIHAIHDKQNAKTSPHDSASPSAPFSFYPEDCAGPSV